MPPDRKRPWQAAAGSGIPDLHHGRQSSIKLLNAQGRLLAACVLTLACAQVTLSSAKVTIPGQVVRIRGEGMPIYGNEIKHGDLIVTYTVDFPKTLTAKQIEAVKQLL